MKTWVKLLAFIILVMSSSSIYSQDLPTYIIQANNCFEINDFNNALPLYDKIINDLGYNDGLILYRQFFSYWNSKGFDEISLKMLNVAYETLLKQYPNHDYTTVLKVLSEQYVSTSITTTTTVYSSYSSSSYTSTSSPDKTVYVNGYTRKDGTYVAPYYRSPPTKKK